MDGWLGRVKECAPGRELPGSSDRESFDDKHGSGTFWAAETSGLGGGGSDGCGGVRRGIVLLEVLEFRLRPPGPETENFGQVVDFSIHVSGASTVQTHIVPARRSHSFSYGCPKPRDQKRRFAVGIERKRPTFGL